MISTEMSGYLIPQSELDPTTTRIRTEYFLVELSSANEFLRSYTYNIKRKRNQKYFFRQLLERANSVIHFPVVATVVDVILR
jgi:hypothetical protein